MLISSPEGDPERSDEMNHWLRTLVVLATLLLMALAAAVVIRLLAFIHHTLLLFSLGGLLAYALSPLVEWLRRVGLPAGKLRRQTPAALAMFGMLGLAILLSLGLVGGFTVRELKTLSQDNVRYQAGMQPGASAQMQQLAKKTYQWRAGQKLAEWDAWLNRHNMHLNLRQNLKHPSGVVKRLSSQVTANVLLVLAGVGKTVVEGALVLLIALYFLIFCGDLRTRFNRGLPDKLRAYSEQWMDDVNAILGGFVRGQLLLALVLGVLSALLCLALGIKLWAILGLFVMASSLIPVVGPYVGGIPAVISALITPVHGFLTPTVRVIVVVIFFVVINEFGSKVLYPRLVGAALGLHEVLVLFVLFAGFEVSGLTGVLFAAPLTALCIATLPQLWRMWQGAPPVSLSTVSHKNGRAAPEKREERLEQ